MAILFNNIVKKVVRLFFHAKDLNANVDFYVLDLLLHLVMERWRDG
jgi:hypothetical protein